MPKPQSFTSTDVAKLAGVSQTTVSLVLRGAADGRVAPSTQARVHAVTERLGYRVSASARSLRSGRSHMLGLVIPNVTDPFFGAVLRGAQAVAAQAGCTIAMIESPTIESLDEAISASTSGVLDGIVVHSPDRNELRRTRQVADRAVVIDGGAPRDLSWIQYDLAHGVELISEHLSKLGHRRVVHLTGDQPKLTFAQRARYLSRHTESEIRTLEVSFDFNAGVAGVERFLRGRPDCTALICDNDSLAAMAFSAARTLGIDLPGELSLIAFNDTPLAEALGMTTVSLPATTAGHLGVEVLLQLLDDQPRSTHTLPTELIIRSSTAPAL